MPAWLNPGTVSLAGAILVALGTFWGWHRQSARSAEIADLNQQLAVKSTEIARLAEDTLAQVTGGDSYVYLQPLRQYPASNVAFYVRQEGRFPTFDVVVRIQDWAGRLLAGPATVGAAIRRGSGFDWTIPAQLVQQWPLVFAEPPATNAQTQQFRIEIAARNGIFVQQIRVWPESGRWHTDSKRIERPGVGPIRLPDDFKEAQEQ